MNLNRSKLDLNTNKSYGILGYKFYPNDRIQNFQNSKKKTCIKYDHNSYLKYTKILSNILNN